MVDPILGRVNYSEMLIVSKIQHLIVQFWMSTLR